MKLNRSSVVNNRKVWQEKGYRVPEYDMNAMIENTCAAPEWIHFGAGNIFRAFIADAQQQLLNDGVESKGIIVAEGFDPEIIDSAYAPFDNMCLAVTLKASGQIEKEVVGSIAEALRMIPEHHDYIRLKQIFEQPSLKMVSFTITEKGYRTCDAEGKIYPDVARDFELGPNNANSYIGKIAALLYQRYLAGQLPVSMVSMDNCSHNGSRLYEAIVSFAEAWSRHALVDAGFVDYVKDRTKVGFPWTMIDKITPRPDAKVVALLNEDGCKGCQNVKTAKGSFVAPFVNAEETQYLIMEDWFPNGHPQLDKVRGICFTQRDTVDKIERMKVCTCLNPLHTALAVYGCLLNYTLISEEMRDADLLRMVKIIGYREGLPVVTNPGILDPKAFIDTVIEVRFPNPFMPDSPQRIATDTSQKLAIRFGETIKAYAKDEKLNTKDLKVIPLVFAGWLRYAMAIDDTGKAFTPSDDPLLPSIQNILRDVKLGDQRDFHAILQPILSNRQIFGVDLYEVGLGELTEHYFQELVAGSGAVRRTLQKYVI